MSKKEFSTYQKAIFEDVSKGTGNTVILAYAGAGKTSTLIEALKYIPKKPKLKTLLIAFNKDIATELRERAPSYIDVSTLHSLGFRAIKKTFGKDITLDPNKTLTIVYNLLEAKGLFKQNKKTLDIAIELCRAIGLCKAYLIDTPTKIDCLLDDFAIETDPLKREDYIKLICVALRLGKENKKNIDYNEMIYFPFVFNMNPGKWDRVFIDECQDLNRGQLHLALSACKPNGRICAVGDHFQSIYSFAGADTKSIETITKKLDAKTLPLSITYRCAKNIVKIAQQFVPDIEAAPWAKAGIVGEVCEKDFLLKVKKGDFILSRTNAPLIGYCLQLLRLNVPANIAGKDVGNGLAYMIKLSGKTTVKDFLIWIEAWKDSEIKRLTEKNRGYGWVLDKYDCFQGLCENATSIESVLANIKKLFNEGDDRSRVILSSIHKSKGLERERVFVLMNTFKKNQDSQEEKNIKYVAFTRAKSELYFVR